MRESMQMKEIFDWRYLLTCTFPHIQEGLSPNALKKHISSCGTRGKVMNYIKFIERCTCNSCSKGRSKWNSTKTEDLREQSD